MKNEKLIPLEDWILKRSEINEKIEDRHYYWEYGSETLDIANKLAQLLKSKPKLRDFVPCDEDGNLLDKPLYYEKFLSKDNFTGLEPTSWFLECEAYQEAERRVLWEGWKCRILKRDDGTIYNEAILSNGLYELFFGDMGTGYEFDGIETYADLTNIGLTFKRDL